MTKKNKIKWFNRAYFPSFVGYCPNAKAWDRFNKWLAKAEDHDIGPYPETAGHCRAIKGKSGKHMVIICVNGRLWKERDRDGKHSLAALTAHEAAHAADFILENVQEEAPGMETTAYMIQYLTECTLHAIRRTRG